MSALFMAFRCMISAPMRIDFLSVADLGHVGYIGKHMQLFEYMIAALLLMLKICPASSSESIFLSTQSNLQELKLVIIP